MIAISKVAEQPQNPLSAGLPGDGYLACKLRRFAQIYADFIFLAVDELCVLPSVRISKSSLRQSTQFEDSKK